MREHLGVGFTGKNPYPACARLWGNNLSPMETRKIYIDYAITIISASDFYVSNTSVSPDEDLITTDTTSSPPLTLSRPLPLSPPCRCMGLQPMSPPHLCWDARSRISSGSMWVAHSGSGSRRRRIGEAVSIEIRC
jgi:hypothetical protein